MSLMVNEDTDNPKSDKLTVGPLRIEVSKVTGRKPVEGVRLEIGEPIITRYTMEVQFETRLGQTQLLSFPTLEDGSGILAVTVTKYVEPPPAGKS